jgi:glycosyltransferase involved in cell wall biosynthesis
MSTAPLRPWPAVSICAPAYNEEGAIDAFVDDCFDALEGKGAAFALDYEVIVVDDGSRDRTYERLLARAASWPRLRVLRHPENRGIPAAWRTIYGASTKPYVFLIGSDGQWRCADLWPMLEAQRRGADVVVGVRQNKSRIYTPFRRVISRGYRLATRLLFGVDLRDPGSLKLAPREVFVTELVSDSVFADAERLLRAVRSGMTIDFVPCHFEPRRTGVATGARRDVVARAARDLVRTFAALRFGRG